MQSARKKEARAPKRPKEESDYEEEEEHEEEDDEDADSDVPLSARSALIQTFFSLVQQKAWSFDIYIYIYIYIYI